MSSAQTRAAFEMLQEAMLTTQQAQAQAAPNTTAMQEAFSRVASMLAREDMGWESLFGGDSGDQFGLTLDQLKDYSARIRESVVGAPWMGQGFRLRHSYVWQRGIRYNLPGPKRGKTNVKSLTQDPLNQLHFFGKEARKKRELALYADGVAFWIGNDVTKKLEAVPLRQIKDQFLEPNGLGYSWAFLREWSEVDPATGEVMPRKLWYFADRFTDKRVATIGRKGDPEPIPVSQTHTIFDQHANHNTGLVYGSPDALAAYVWSDLTKQAYMDGIAMVRALSTFALKASVKTANGGESAAIKLGNPQGAGQTAVIGGANDLVPLASAGRGYDFSSLTALLAVVATALSVSVIHLSSNPGDAGASYGASETLSLPVRLAMEARRDEHVDLDKRVLRWMGLDDPEVYFIGFDAGDEVYRAAQTVVMGWVQGFYSPDEAKEHFENIFGREEFASPPEGIQIPNNINFPGSLSNDQQTPTLTPQTASPTQGKSSASGTQGSAGNDIRRDQ